jgi:2-iminobutanoate/2-iminopropanoate deaminase
MQKQIIYTKEAPEPIGPYCQAVFSAGTLFVSGQIPIDPKTGELVKESIEAETHQVMINLEAILVAANMTFYNVVKCSIYLTDLNNFQKVNQVYGGYFKENPPARETLGVSQLPKGAHVEISCVAIA